MHAVEILTPERDARFVFVMLKENHENIGTVLSRRCLPFKVYEYESRLFFYTGQSGVDLLNFVGEDSKTLLLSTVTTGARSLEFNFRRPLLL